MTASEKGVTVRFGGQNTISGYVTDIYKVYRSFAYL